MKFTFYIGGKKKKQQVIKVKSTDDLMTIAKIVKCELTKNSLLKDLDFSSNGKLLCSVKDKEFTMKELWHYIEPKLKGSDISNGIKKKKKHKKSSISGEKSKKKDKKKTKKKSSKKKDKSKQISKSKNDVKTSNGLVHITRR